MTTPLVSVVIPTYNYGHYVHQAIDSALAQTYPAVEVIVVDDGSTDNTHERIAHYGERIRYVHQSNQGLSAARNTGIVNAKGEYIALLDSDDAFHPRKIERQMAVIRKRHELGLVGTAAFSDEPPTWKVIADSEPEFTILALPELVMRSHFAPSSALLRRNCFDRVGLFDTSLRSVEDRDMWIRVGAHYPVATIPEQLTWYRVTPGSMSRNPERMEQFENIVLDKAFAMPELLGSWLLRRKARSLADLTSGFTYFSAGRPGTAARRLFRSLVSWPWPFRKTEVHEPWVRLRLLGAALRGCLKRSTVQPVVNG